MATTPTYINQRINNLQSQINAITSGGVPTTSDLAVVLGNGNSAGTFDIDMNFNDITNVNSVVIDNNAGNTITAGNNQIDFTSTAINPSVISNSSGQDMNIVSTGILNLSASTNMDATAVTFNTTAVNDINLVSSNFGSIQTVAPNFNCNGFAMPICFTRERADTFTYNFGGQVFENVYSTQVNIPYQFFSDTPTSGYTSTYWKIDFALNCYTNSSIGDKGIAMYIEFLDQATNPYNPSVYNSSFPYAVYQPSSTYGGGSAPFQNFNWSDLIDFSGLVSTGSGNVPLNMNFWIAGDNAFTCNFNMVMTLTRTNLI
jgi:hypothetical protein